MPICGTRAYCRTRELEGDGSDVLRMWDGGLRALHVATLFHAPEEDSTSLPATCLLIFPLISLRGWPGRLVGCQTPAMIVRPGGGSIMRWAHRKTVVSTMPLLNRTPSAQAQATPKKVHRFGSSVTETRVRRLFNRARMLRNI